MNTNRVELLRLSAADAAIDGLFKGVLAGIVMFLSLAIAGMLIGDHPAVILSRFSPSANPSPLSGLLTHLGVSAVYGAIFGLACWIAIWRRRIGLQRRVFLAAGLAYGLALWLLAQLIILPGTGSSIAEFAVGSLALAHLLYGALLGLTVQRLG